MKNYHCDRKFDSLKIDIEKKTLYSCWKATGEQIDLNWLEKNTGKIFNTKNLQSERTEMLNNKRVKSCEQTCFSKEDKNIWSPRLQYKGYLKENQLVESYPKTLDVTISGECNMSCSYCCKEYSSTWRNDIIKNGDYVGLSGDPNRYKLSAHDLIISKISQKKRTETKSYKIIKNEILLLMPKVQQLSVSGGEPFLNDRLFDLLELAKDVPQIQIISGLGINAIRFKNSIQKIKKYNNISLRISVDSTGENYEFNRYGNSWKKFLDNLQIIRDNNIDFFFNTTYCNLTILDYVNFYEQFSEIRKNFNVVYDPCFLSPHVLDESTKEHLINQMLKSKVSNLTSTTELIKLLSQRPNEDDRKSFESFVKEFSKRRNAKLSFLPDSLKRWLKI
jgi:organic radical activating enzyme